jgi:hypothetical protein
MASILMKMLRSFKRRLKNGEWNEFGVTLMCDSWTGPTQKSMINFLVYCNGMMYF